MIVDMQVDDLFWSSSTDQLKKGYVKLGERFVCLVCGHGYDEGEVYPDGNKFYAAEKMAALHVESSHGSMFHYLIGLNKKFTGLTDLQKSLLSQFYDGATDAEIVKKLNGGSTSTIRAHRYSLREKEKQAKVFLAIMELLNQRQEQKHSFIGIHKTATTVDQRYAITVDENDEIIAKYFPQGLDGGLTGFPKKEKRKIAILKHIMTRFVPRRNYTEKEVNELLKQIYPIDYVTLRRYLIEYGFMDRHDDGSHYWVKQ